MTRLGIVGTSRIISLLVLAACNGGNAAPQAATPDLLRRQSGTGDVVLHSFSASGGYNPMGPVALASGASTVFGATPFSNGGGGTIFKWTSPNSFSTIFTFPSTSCSGEEPLGGVSIDSSGALYGTTFEDSTTYLYSPGLVFKLTPSGSGYTCRTLHAFGGSFVSPSDGANPEAALTIDSGGNLYGTTAFGGISNLGCGTSSGPMGCGIVFELSPSGSGYSYNVLYRFGGGSDGALPAGGLLRDASGNLYGTTESEGSSSSGTVYKLSNSGGLSWALTTLHTFGGASDGTDPTSALVRDGSGNLYGTTIFGGAHNCGTIFKLHPTSGGTYSESVLHSFSCGAGRVSGLTLAAGSLWGAHESTSGSCCGAIFDADPSTGSTFEFSVFQGYPNDGAAPVSPPFTNLWFPTGYLVEQPGLVDALYGVTISGGTHTGTKCEYGSGSYWTGCGTLYAIDIGSAREHAKPRLRKIGAFR